MTFVKITSPRKPQVEAKINRTNIVLTPEGLAKIADIAPALSSKTTAVLWWDASLGKAAITVAMDNDPDAVSIEYVEKGAVVRAKFLFEQAGLKPGAKLAKPQLEASENGGIAITFAGAARPVASQDANAVPKRRGRRPKNAVV
ncbi:MAG: hypothetical protein P4L33_21775 [Capsulimonadaceae bacterium]|nr:hypothetical protein [Capsulimonadaceae bacterium]